MTKHHVLNESGRRALAAAIIKHCPHHAGINPYPWFPHAECNADDGRKDIEIRGRYTDSGNPVIIDLDPAWFDLIEIPE